MVASSLGRRRRYARTTRLARPVVVTSPAHASPRHPSGARERRGGWLGAPCRAGACASAFDRSAARCSRAAAGAISCGRRA
jgi:hypothetical protein